MMDGTRSTTLDTSVVFQKIVEKTIGKIPFICLVNKTDMTKVSKINGKEIDGLKARGWHVAGVSAKTGQGVNRAFMTLAAKMLK